MANAPDNSTSDNVLNYKDLAKRFPRHRNALSRWKEVEASQQKSAFIKDEGIQSFLAGLKNIRRAMLSRYEMEPDITVNELWKEIEQSAREETTAKDLIKAYWLGEVVTQLETRLTRINQKLLIKDVSFANKQVFERLDSILQNIENEAGTAQAIDIVTSWVSEIGVEMVDLLVEQFKKFEHNAVKGKS